MAIDYAQMRATATRLLRENGAAWVLTRGRTVHRDDQGNEIVTPPLTADVWGVVTQYKPSEIDGTVIYAGDVKLAATYETEIKVDDRIDIGGKKFRVVTVNEIRPAALLLSYIIQLRG